MPYILSPYIYVYNIPKSEKFPSVTEAEGAHLPCFFLHLPKLVKKLSNHQGLNNRTGLYLYRYIYKSHRGKMGVIYM